MKNIVLISILTFMIFIGFYSCKKTQPDQNNPDQNNLDTINQNVVQGDGLTKEQNLAIELSSVTNPSLKEILDPNGTPLGSPLGTSGDVLILIRKILTYAEQLSEKKTLLNKKEGNEMPEHFGLAYSSGVRNFRDRKKPSDGDKFHRFYSVYGTDCSGFIINLFQEAGVDVSESSYVQNNTIIPNIKKALEKKKVTIELVPSNEPPESGDLIVWSNHIGIIYYTLDKVRVYQSNGDPNPGSESEQQRNLGLKRGVHPFDLATMVQPPATHYWGTNYKLYRLKNLSISITTTAATDVTHNSATSGGEISDDGGSPITARGVCYSTSPNPTIANSKTSDGTGKGVFKSQISGLKCNTSYYVRAFAINSNDTAYGDVVSFKTTIDNSPAAFPCDTYAGKWNGLFSSTDDSTGSASPQSLSLESDSLDENCKHIPRSTLTLGFPIFATPWSSYEPTTLPFSVSFDTTFTFDQGYMGSLYKIKYHYDFQMNVSSCGIITGSGSETNESWIWGKDPNSGTPIDPPKWEHIRVASKSLNIEMKRQ